MNQFVANMRTVYWSLLLVFVLVPGSVFGLETPPPCDPQSVTNIKLCNPIKYPDIDKFLMAVVDIVVKYGALLVVLFLVYSGFQFVTAQGNTEKLATAKQNLTWIIIGAFVLLGVYVIKSAICGTVKELGVVGICAS